MNFNRTMAQFQIICLDRAPKIICNCPGEFLSHFHSQSQCYSKAFPWNSQIRKRGQRETEDLTKLYQLNILFNSTCSQCQASGNLNGFICTDLSELMVDLKPKTPWCPSSDNASSSSSSLRAFSGDNKENKTEFRTS